MLKLVLKAEGADIVEDFKRGVGIYIRAREGGCGLKLVGKEVGLVRR